MNGFEGLEMFWCKKDVGESAEKYVFFRSQGKERKALLCGLIFFLILG